MTSTCEYTFAITEDGYSVSYNGSPLMATTPDRSRAVAVLEQWVANSRARNLSPTVTGWDGRIGQTFNYGDVDQMTQTEQE